MRSYIRLLVSVVAVIFLICGAFILSGKGTRADGADTTRETVVSADPTVTPVPNQTGPALPSGMPSLPTGMPALPTGIPALPTGFPSLPTGFPALPTGTISWPTGFPALPTGFPSLPTGIPSIPTGFPSLPTGIPSIPTGLPASPSVSATATPTAKPEISITLNKTTANIVCGKDLALKATVKGSDASVVWVSSNPLVASVDQTGKISAIRAGSVTITAFVSGKTSSCTVCVLYKDVTDSGEFWYKPTYYLTDKGVVQGYADQTEFRPANECTRAQMVTFIWRLAGQPLPKSATCKFTDVSLTDYFYTACIWGNENHIVEGYKDGTFGPQIVCARRHAVTFLWRMAGKPAPVSSKNKFSDVNKDDYYYTATLWASEKGILVGYKDGTFRPNGNCLRRQMVTFLYKYDKNVYSKTK